MYLGWFLLPITLPVILTQWFAGKSTHFSRPVRFLLFLFAAASLLRFIIVPSLMPVHNNVIIPQGIGPPTLKDTQNLHLHHLPPLPVSFWLFVTGISLLGAALLIINATSVFSRPVPDSNSERVIQIFFLLSALIYLAPLLMSGFFDRYLIPVLPFLAAFAVVSLPATGYRLSRAHWTIAIVFVLISGIFAIAGTRDYLEWNRTRWIAAKDLLARQQVSPQKVDGGFEFNGWYS